MITNQEFLEWCVSHSENSCAVYSWKDLKRLIQLARLQVTIHQTWYKLDQKIILDLVGKAREKLQHPIDRLELLTD